MKSQITISQFLEKWSPEIQTMNGENLSGLKIILDTCYGSATTCAKKIFQSLGADVRVINNSQNGLKINMHCGSTNLEPLKKALRERVLQIWVLASMGMQIE